MLLLFITEEELLPFVELLRDCRLKKHIFLRHFLHARERFTL